MIEIYGPEYLRAPNDEDTRRLMSLREEQIWPVMLISIDCMHEHARIVPRDGNISTKGIPKIQPSSSRQLHERIYGFWHSYLRLLGSYNDLNVL